MKLITFVKIIVLATWILAVTLATQGQVLFAAIVFGLAAISTIVVIPVDWRLALHAHKDDAVRWPPQDDGDDDDDHEDGQGTKDPD